MFDGTMWVGFSPNEVDGQIEAILSANPKTEEESEELTRILNRVIENDKAKRNMS